ncbi:MAG: FAD-dependent oxidoreductase [Myxococcales bacterium]|nr:FAD-dependent oxidoreductase [Myxococcales bacterium]
MNHDLVIIGCGFAGLSAALQAGRLGLATLVLDPIGMGGQILNTDRIENYPGFPDGISGMDLVTAAEQQATSAGVSYGFGTVTGLEVADGFITVLADGESHTTRSVILASGGQRRALGVADEAKFEGRGVSHCATCDGPMYADQDVAVIGGGDSALDEALYLTSICRSVALVCRDTKLSALKVLVDRAAESSKLDVLLNTRLESLGGAAVLASIGVADTRSGAERRLDVTGVFPCIGTAPATEAFAKSVPLDGGGHVVVDIDMATEVPGVFAAGACRWKSAGQLASAAGDGITAALSAYHWLDSRQQGSRG